MNGSLQSDAAMAKWVRELEEAQAKQNAAKINMPGNNVAEPGANVSITTGTAFNPRWSNQTVPTDANGRPLSPGFVSIGDEDTGLLRDPYKLSSSLNMDALNQLRTETLSGAPSKWSQLQQVMQGDALTKQNASNIQGAQNNLAAQGGLRGGAAERLQTAGVQSGLMANQAMRANIANQDEQNRQTNLRALPGMEQQAAGYNDDVNKYNIEGAKGEILQRRAFDVNQYNEAMRGWASAKAAAAAPSGGKK